MRREKEYNRMLQRERNEPTELGRPVPLLVLFVIVSLFLWSVYYIAVSDLHSPASFGDNRTTADFEVAESTSIDGGQLYTANCVACHQASGAGVPGVFPPLSASEWVQGKPEVVVQILLHGITGELTVEGTTYNGVMPDFGSKFNDEEIAALVNHLRTSFGNEANTIDADLVKAQREATADRTTPWNGDADLQKLEEQ